MNELTPVASISHLKAVMDQGLADGTLQPVEAPLEHYRAGDLYGRRMCIAADSSFVTKVHKTDNFLIALRGHATVVNEKGETYEVIAPQVLVTKPGTLRAVYTHTDIEWFTAHICPELEPEERDRYLACDTMDEYIALQLENQA